MVVTLRRAAGRLGTRQVALPCTCAASLVSRASPALSRRLHSSSSSSLLARPSRIHFSARHLATAAAAASTSAPKHGPTAAYDHQVEEGIIVNDDHQRGIISLLQDMYDKLDAYTPPEIGPLPPPRKPSLLTRISRSRFFATMEDELHQANRAEIPLPPAPRDLPKGLYLYGSVGCGKSFLMDLFYANMPSKYEHSKRRVHFHAFMMDVHRRGHRIKMEKGEAQDWIVLVARDLAKESRVLCFDEFQVTGELRRARPRRRVEADLALTDIADAMILRRLMEALHAYGVVSITTSK